MTTTMEAVYEHGMLRLEKELPLPENARVEVTIRSSDEVENSPRAQWLRLSENSLCKAWAHPGDDVFNALLEK